MFLQGQASGHPQLSESADGQNGASTTPSRYSTEPHRHSIGKLRAHSSSVTPPTWSSTLPTLPSARAHVQTTPDTAIEGYSALTQPQRSTGPMRRRGSSTATGTGCDRYVYFGKTCNGRESLEPAQRVCALEGSMRDPGCGPQETRRDETQTERRIAARQRLTRNNRRPRCRPCTR